MRLSHAFSLLAVTGASNASLAETKQRRSGNFKGEMISAHNFFRAQHGARELTWNSVLAQKAQKWANTCNWSHDSTGENLARGTSLTSWGAFVDMWGSERKNYNWNKAGFSMNSGHFTQVVWKSTRSVGCGWQKCGGGQGKASGFYVVCKYTPAGNHLGQFRHNVGWQTKGKPSDVWHE